MYEGLLFLRLHVFLTHFRCQNLCFLFLYIDFKEIFRHCIYCMLYCLSYCMVWHGSTQLDCFSRFAKVVDITWYFLYYHLSQGSKRALPQLQKGHQLITPSLRGSIGSTKNKIKIHLVRKVSGVEQSRAVETPQNNVVIFTA